MAAFLIGHDYEHVSHEGLQFQKVKVVSHSDRDDGMIVRFVDDVLKKHKKEFVRITSLREIPAINLEAHYNVGSLVDYKVNKLWKTGVIQEITSQGHFVADLPISNKSVSRLRSCLRPHVIWVNPIEV